MKQIPSSLHSLVTSLCAKMLKPAERYERSYTNEAVCATNHTQSGEPVIIFMSKSVNARIPGLFDKQHQLAPQRSFRGDVFGQCRYGPWNGWQPHMSPWSPSSGGPLPAFPASWEPQPTPGQFGHSWAHYRWFPACFPLHNQPLVPNYSRHCDVIWLLKTTTKQSSEEIIRMDSVFNLIEFKG